MCGTRLNAAESVKSIAVCCLCCPGLHCLGCWSFSWNDYLLLLGSVLAGTAVTDWSSYLILTYCVLVTVVVLIAALSVVVVAMPSSCISQVYVWYD